MSNITIRKITQNDREAWGDLWNEYLAFYGTELSSEIYETTFERLLSDDPQEFQGLIAEKDGQLLGLVHFLFHRHGWKIANVCYLQDLYVNEAARGTGAGRALIEAVYTHADHIGSPDVYWLTQEDNETARRLYDRIGKVTPFIKYAR